MAAVTCIGLGLMGSALARAALASGHAVAVWNRTPGKAKTLADIGALVTDTLGDAIAASAIILICIDNYASTRVLLETDGVAKLLAGRTIVNLTTSTPREAEALSAWAGAQGAHYLDGAILCDPNAIGTEGGEVVFSGDVLAWRVAGPLLTCLAGKVRTMGQRVGDAAALDVAWLTMSYVKFIGVAHAAAICRAQGIDLQAFIELFPADPSLASWPGSSRTRPTINPPPRSRSGARHWPASRCRRGMWASRPPYRILSPVTSSGRWAWVWGNRKRWRSTRLFWQTKNNSSGRGGRMSDAVLAAFGVTEADLLGSGWESRIYALGATRILRIPRPEAGSEDQVRARAAFTANLPSLPFEVPRVREISRIDGQLYVIEDRIAGQSMATLLPGLSGERRAQALRAYLAAAEAMAVATAPDEAFGDLLLDRPRRSEHWSDYLIGRVRTAAKDDVLAADIPGFAGIVERFIARLATIPDPAKCIVHGDIWPPNVMMNDALQVTGLIDFSFTTRIGDHVMDLAAAAYHPLASKSPSQADHAYVKQLILAKHGAEVIDRMQLYSVWFAFDFAFNHDDATVYAWCVNQIRSFAD